MSARIPGPAALASLMASGLACGEDAAGGDVDPDGGAGAAGATGADLEQYTRGMERSAIRPR